MRDDIPPPSGKPDPKQARCYDCAFLKCAVSWWCKNEDAIAWRGTSLPGVSQCPFWVGHDGTPVAPEIAAKAQPKEN